MMVFFVFLKIKYGHTEDKVVRAEDLAEWSRAHRVHGARLEVHQDSTRDILPTCGGQKKINESSTSLKRTS